MPSTVDFAALSLLPPEWRIDVIDELRRGGDAGEILNACLAARPHAPGLTPGVVRSRAAAASARGATRGLASLAWSDASYPAMLAAIVDPPPMLWLRGSAAAFERPAVAIVGSRAGSPYALAVAERLAGDLAERGLAIVSGLARGVDSAAHRGALDAGGVTIGVLGSGADVMYPPEHEPLAREMARRGAIVSELLPGTRPLKMFFPRRNRIISGLSRAVVVVEAGERSGSLITARSALDQGREVLAVPGNVLGGRNRGGHALLRDGAKIVETADDILEELGLASSRPAAAGVAPVPAADPILASLTPGESVDADRIAERSGLPIARVLPRLLELELRGWVRRVGGGRFMRI